MAKKPPLFLERDSYRYRRAVDAARLLPVLGVLLWLIPAFWNQVAAPTTQLSQAMLYIFGVWLLLIGLCAFVSSRIARRGDVSNDTMSDDPKAASVPDPDVES